MFEVGKKYKVQHSGNIALCVALSDKEVVLEYDNGRFAICSPDHYKSWSEYKEPVIVKTKRGVIKRADDTVYTDHLGIGPNCIGSVEFTVTDGKLTDVRIIE